MANFRPFPPNGTDPWGNPIRNWASDVESNITAVEQVASDAVPNTVAGRTALAGSPELSASIDALIAAGVPPLIAAALADLDPELLEPAIEAAIAGMSIYSMRDVLTAGTDLDALSAPAAFGFYQLTSGGSYPNRPSGTSGVALLEVFGSANAVVQRISHTGVGYDWTRNKLSAGSWSAWTPSMASRGALPTGTNVATLTGVTHSGMYRLSAANSYTGIPASVSGVEATLEVQYISTSVVQRITAAGAMWQRFFAGGWSEWRRYGPESVFVGANDPEAMVSVGQEYAWIRTDGNGTFVDILVGKRAS